jgi:hypothetical protein
VDPTQQQAASGLNLSSLLGGLLSAGGTGLAASNQQQAYNGLKSALNTIGPTNLNGYSLGGPGGMSSGYGTNGTGSIGLGALDPAFSSLAGTAGSGSSLYNPNLLAELTNNANGTLGQATNALTGAYGNYNIGMGAAYTQLGNLGDFNTNYNNLLGAYRAQSAPGVQQAAYGLQNTLFGNGVADSTGAASGALAAQNFGRGVAQADSSNQLNAFQGALQQQNSAASNYGTLTNTANGILSNALNNFGNTNQLISGLNTAQLNNSLQAIQGAGALNTLGLNNYNAALQTGMGQATARNQSLFPYASVATSLAGTQNGSNILANGLSSAGSSLMGNNGLGGLLSGLLGSGTNGSNGSAGASGIGGLLSKLIGGGGSGNTAANQQQINGFLNDLNSSGSLNGNDFTNLNLGNDSSILGSSGTFGSNGFMSNGDSNLMNTDFSSGSLFGNSFDQSLLDQYNAGDGFSGAGGQAAEPMASNFQSTSTTPASDAYQATAPDSSSPVTGSSPNTLGLSSIGTGLGVYNGLQSGTATGYTGAGLGAAKLGSQAGLFGSDSKAVGSAAGAGMNALGIYTGLQQGGVKGDTSAAVNAAQLGSKMGAFGSYSGAVGTAAGYVAAPLALYNFASNYESGKTGSDALNGAEAGAAIGSIVPGIGTVLGGVIGGAVGALSSAFGPGAKDPETAGVQGLIDATSSNGNTSQVAANVQNPYVQLAGLFDRRDSTLPMYAQYGRMGEQKFTQDFASQINNAISSGKISASTPPDQVYNQVIAPWVNSMGKGWSNVGDAYKATTQGLLQDMTRQYMNGTAAQNWKAVGGDSPFENIYQGSAIKAAPTPKPVLAGEGSRRAGARL